MATLEIDEAAHITFRLNQLATNEIIQWGFSTAKRGEFSILTLLDAMASWFEDAAVALVEQVTCSEIVYSEWGTSGFVGFHQVQSKIVSLSTGTGAVLPPQCAAVVTLLNLEDVADSIKRRRGRMYFGTLPTSLIGSDGRLTTAAQDVYLVEMDELQSALNGVASASGNLSGLCIASRAGGTLYDAGSVGIGRGVDTQRRRREKVVEEIAYQALVLT